MDESFRRRPRASDQSLDYYLGLQYPFVVITDAEERGYVIKFPDLPGCFTQADTMDEIGPMAEEVRTLWIETEYEAGGEIPLPSYYEEYSGKFNVRLPRSLHRELAESAEREGVSLNQHVVALLSGGDATARIERKIDAVAGQINLARGRVTRVAEEPTPYHAEPRQQPRPRSPRPSARKTASGQATPRKRTP